MQGSGQSHSCVLKDVDRGWAAVQEGQGAGGEKYEDGVAIQDAEEIAA